MLLVFGINAVWMYFVHGLNAFSLGAQIVRFERFQQSFEFAQAYWILPGQLILWWLFAFAMLFSISWALRNTVSSIRVYGLVIERITELMLGFGGAAFFAQIGAFWSIQTFANLVLYPDPRLFESLEAIAGSILLFIPMSIVGMIYASYALWASIGRTIRIQSELISCVRYASLDRRAYRRVDAPVFRDEPPRCDVLIVSDLHITRPHESTLQHSLDCSAGLIFVERLAQQTKPKVVVVCGDITDTGDPEALERANTFFKGIAVPVVGTIGNHDVHFGKMSQHHESAWAYLKWMTKGFRNDPKGVEGVPLPYGFSELFSALNPSASSSFPILHSSPHIPIDILAIDSNRRPSTSPITNAVGQVGSQQLSDAACLLDRREDNKKPLLLVLHHHVLPYNTTWRNVFESYFSMCTDSSAVLSFARRHGVSAILHGHLHMPYQLCPVAGNGNSVVISCGSALFNAKGPRSNIAAPTACGLQIADSAISGIVIYAPTTTG